MNSPTDTQTELSAYVWDEGEAPQGITADPGIDMHQLEVKLCNVLETKAYGKIVALRGGEALELVYHAFTDEYRGRHIVSGITMEELAKNVAELKQEFTVKCFTPRELYDLRPIRTSYNLYHLINVHLPEANIWDTDTDAVEATEQIEKRIIADECPDGRRTWTLETVWFRGLPVMIVNSSGRDGDEYKNRWITNKTAFEEMIAFLRSFTKSEPIEGLVDDLDKVIPQMTEFYNATIHEYYDVEQQVAKVKEKREK